jgi:hypothetical protein
LAHVVSVAIKAGGGGETSSPTRQSVEWMCRDRIGEPSDRTRRAVRTDFDGRCRGRRIGIDKEHTVDRWDAKNP